MKYYFVSYPEKVAGGFAGTAKGPLIKIEAKSCNDLGLLEHEKTHVRQWYGVSIAVLLVGVIAALVVSPAFWGVCVGAFGVHSMLYHGVRPYRQWSEVQAYRKQLATGGYPNREFAAKHLAEKYDLGLTLDQARALLN